MKLPVFCILLFTLAANASNVRDLYLPSWYAKAVRQIFRLELKDLKAERILLDQPCTVSPVRRTIEVTNGATSVNLSIDLRTTPSTFPLVVLAVDDKGRTTEYERLICHLSLVAEPIQIRIKGETFAITNLTEEPFELERTANLTITSQDDRHILGTLKGSGRLKLKGRAEMSLVPNRPSEAVR